MKTPGRILFALTGSIACFKACALLSKLAQAGFDLEVIATKGALEFVGRASLEGLIGKAIHTDTFEAGQYMAHIHLAKWADLTVIYPASANSINKMAGGIGDDLLSTTMLAHDYQNAAKSIWISPAMNSKMYAHPATQASMTKLTSWGCRILETGSGQLACGDVGEGRLLEPEVVLREIQNYFSTFSQALATSAESKSAQLTPVKSLNVLITSGGSREAIDGVRAISNTSSGRTGAMISRQLAEAGHRVTLLRSEDAITSEHADVRDKTYIDFASLAKALEATLTNGSGIGASRECFDAVIHLAAVADYSVAGIRAGNGASSAEMTPSRDLKIDSQGDLNIRLKQNPKLVDRVREWSGNPKLKLAAFKLTNTLVPTERLNAVQKLASHAQADWIVHNDLHEIDANHHVFSIFETTNSKKPEAPTARLRQVEELAQWFDKTLAAQVETGPPERLSAIPNEPNQARTL